MSWRHPVTSVWRATVAWQIIALATIGAPCLAAQTSVASGARAIVDSVAVRVAIDSLVQDAMARLHVPGAAVIVVHDGEVLLERGYGVANLTSRKPVDPERTVFGVSSVSKVFTAAAMVQLAERGHLQLTDDVNAQIGPWHLAEPFGRAVTIANLLTHTGGFDDLTIGVGAKRAADVRPLGLYLASDMPPQVRPPGTVASYSNHGFALAGYVVERASGLPFAAYIDQEIFRPLGMTRSSFTQPLPDSLEAVRATGYRVEGEQLVPVPRIFFNDAPASALFTTAGDMGRWLRIALRPWVRDSTHAATLVLSPQSVAILQRRQWANDSALPGLAYGMRERNDLGVRVLEQGGAWEDYSSDLLLAPSERLGMFLAFNAEAGEDMADTVWHAVLRGLSGAPRPEAAPSWMRWPVGQAAARNPVTDLAGIYRENRYSRHTIARLGVLSGDVQEVALTVRLDSAFLDGSPLERLGPGVFRSGETGHRVVWRAAAPGSPSLLFLENAPYEGFERVPWYDRRDVNIALVGVIFIGALLSLGRRLWRWLRTLRTPRAHSTGSGLSVSVGTLSIAALLDCLVLAFLIATTVALLTTDVWAFQYGMTPVFRILGLVPWVIAALALAVAGFTGVRRTVDRGNRVAWMPNAASTVLGLTLLWFTWHWNLIAKL